MINPFLKSQHSLLKMISIRPKAAKCFNYSTQFVKKLKRNHQLKVKAVSFICFVDKVIEKKKGEK